MQKGPLCTFVTSQTEQNAQTEQTNKEFDKSYKGVLLLCVFFVQIKVGFCCCCIK